jgi:hypothetical protein
LAFCSLRSLILANNILPIIWALYAKGVHLKYLYLSIVILVSGCSSQSLEEQLTDTALEAITGKEYSRNTASCARIEKRCGTHGNYQEWYQDNGKLACACND